VRDHPSESVRAVLLTPAGQVLLMRVAGWTAELWITPGGRIRPDEPPAAALAREIEEETGLSGIIPGTEIWVRHATFVVNGRDQREKERFFLVPSSRFEPATARLEPAERDCFREFRWWSVEEISRSKECFAPQRLAELLLLLQREGPPISPLETGA